MRNILFLLFTLTSVFAFANAQDELSQIRTFLKNDELAKAKELALDLKERTKDRPDSEDYFRVNYLLGYIFKEDGDFGKSIIYYLESIRLAENSDQDFTSDLISLYNRSAIIYRQFKAYELAEEYYSKGIDLAVETGNKKMITLLNFNRAGVLIDNERYDEALQLLSDNIDLANELDYKLDDYYNRTASVYLKLHDYRMALDYYLKLEGLVSSTDFEMLGYLRHNMALAYEGLGRYNDAEAFFVESITLKKQDKDKSLLFTSYFDLGRLKYHLNEFDDALANFNLAIDVIPNNSLTPKEIEVYKFKANALFQNKRYVEAKSFEDQYANQLNQYLEVQEKVQDSDKSYNMDLITKRYFDEVAKQERIAKILFISKLISGSLLALLLFTIGLNWYQKVQLRKSIIQDLINLKVVD